MNKWWPLVAVCLGAFMLLVDVTIVTVALPQMARGLDASLTGLQWVVDAYALALAALALAAGSVADRIGRRRVYLVGLVGFAVASLACGLAPGSGTLIAARVVQGAAAAAMFATLMALLNAEYQGRDRGVAFGAWGAITGAAAALGPVLGGLLTQHLNWRWIFFLNLPVSVVALVLTRRVVRESHGNQGARLDVPGTAAFAVAAAALTYALIRAGGNGWSDRPALALFAASAVALLLFVAIELRVRHPMLDLRLFRRPSFTAMMATGALVSAGAFAYMVYTSLWLQAGLGYGPVLTGLVLLPMAVTVFVVSALTGRLLHGASPRPTIGVGMLLIGAGAAAQAVLDAGSSWTALVPGLVVTGVGVGVVMPGLNAAAMASAPARHAGMAAGAFNTFRQLGLALGIAVLGVVFRAGAAGRLHGRVPNPSAAADALGAGRPIGDPYLARAAFAAGLNGAFLAACAFGVAAGVLVLLFVRRPVPVTGDAREPARASA